MIQHTHGWAIHQARSIRSQVTKTRDMCMEMLAAARVAGYASHRSAWRSFSRTPVHAARHALDVPIPESVGGTVLPGGGGQAGGGCGGEGQRSKTPDPLRISAPSHFPFPGRGLNRSVLKR